jgi:excisionase family DNA binding protein
VSEGNSCPVTGFPPHVDKGTGLQEVTVDKTPRRRNLVAVEAAAEYLGVAPLTVRRRIASGQLRAYRLGPRIIRVDLADVDAMLEPIPTVGGGANVAV